MGGRWASCRLDGVVALIRIDSTNGLGLTVE